MRQPGRVAMLLLGAASAGFGQQITLLVLPFRSVSAQDAAIGAKVGVILNLQVWKTLRIPPDGPGHSSKGEIIWDLTSKPPASYAEADQLAKNDSADNPQLVLWGRTWKYGAGNVVQAYLSIRSNIAKDPVGKQIWRAAPDSATAFSVDLPRWQVEFAPIVLRSDLAPELLDPAGLKLYSQPAGGAVLGAVGGAFRALEQDADTAKVLLPDGTQGWIRLPNLSKDPSEVVSFTGGVIRMLRQDWKGAAELFQKVLANPHTPAAVKVDACLYLAVAAEKTGADPLPWIRQAYDLNPYSKTTILYLCMSHLSVLSRLQGDAAHGPEAKSRVGSLADILDHNRSLFAQNDPWIAKLQHFIAKSQ